MQLASYKTASIIIDHVSLKTLIDSQLKKLVRLMIFNVVLKWKYQSF